MYKRLTKLATLVPVSGKLMAVIIIKGKPPRSLSMLTDREMYNRDETGIHSGAPVLETCIRVEQNNETHGNIPSGPPVRKPKLMR